MFRNIKMEYLEEIRQQYHAVVVDLREEKEYQMGHIKNAINYPFSKLERDVYQGACQLDRSNIYILYCEFGSSSSQASAMLDRMGYDVINAFGGYNRFLDFMGRTT